MATSSIELSKLCKLATLPERNGAGNGSYIIRSNCYKIIGPLTTARVSTGISLKFMADGIIGRLSTSESTLVQSKLMVAVENLRQGHIQVILLNTSATCEASIVPGTVIGELSFHHAVSPLLYWREEMQNNGVSLSLGERKRQAKALKPRRHNRCDNVSNWRMSRGQTTTKPNVITITPQPEDQTGDNATSEVWDLPTQQHKEVEDWDGEAAEEPTKFGTFKLNMSNRKFGEWKRKPYMTANLQAHQHSQKNATGRKWIPLQKRSNLVTVTSAENETCSSGSPPPKYSPEQKIKTNNSGAEWEAEQTTTTWGNWPTLSTWNTSTSWATSSKGIFTWPPVKTEEKNDDKTTSPPVKTETNGKKVKNYKDHVIFVDSPTSPEDTGDN